MNELYRIVHIFIYCWRLSKEFRQNADFTAYGITPYSFERYNDVNKMIKDYHMKIDIHSKNVKSLIISVMKPLMYQYTCNNFYHITLKITLKIDETIDSFINYWVLECNKNQGLSSKEFPHEMLIELINS